METHPPLIMKSNLMKNMVAVRLLSFGIFILLLRFAYLLSLSCSSSNSPLCFSSPLLLTTTAPITATLHLPDNSAVVASTANLQRRRKHLHQHHPLTLKNFRESVTYTTSIFQELISDGFLHLNSSSLCVETLSGSDVLSLRELGVHNSIGISSISSYLLTSLSSSHKKVKPPRARPLVVYGLPHRMPFPKSAFDFIFSAEIDRSPRPVKFAAEICRTLKPGRGHLVLLTRTRDLYSYNSLLNLFDCCVLVRTRNLPGPNPTIPTLLEIVLKKQDPRLIIHRNTTRQKCNSDGGDGGGSSISSSIAEHKRELIVNSEPLIADEPLKPWISLKRNMKNIKYLTSSVDISFKRRYVYIDVGARSYGSSIGSWFKKRYPKQNKTFEIYAIEADKAFHDEYRSRKKSVTLLPYAAWVRNETLFFEINREPNAAMVGKSGSGGSGGSGMGRVRQPVRSSADYVGGGSSEEEHMDRIMGFDFAEWVKNEFTEKDFVVVKMDIEGAEFHLIPKLIESGASCLIDEMFVECHYNRWQRCCPNVRSPKYQKTYGECLELLSGLRRSGVLVHQWW